MTPEDPRLYADSTPRPPPRTVNLSLGLRVSATPAFGLALGFTLSVLGLCFGNTDGVHDVSLALISGSLGMFAQIFKSNRG